MSWLDSRNGPVWAPESEFIRIFARGYGRKPWAWAKLQGLDYRPGTLRIVVALYDVADWRGPICRVTSERRTEQLP